jgi:glycosyltransferase involved in cell wall biosynthesis
MEQNMKLVSVLMNCYNGEKYLREAIDSVYAQSYTNWEIIFIDNCSTDSSSEIAKSYDSRLRYFKTSENVCLGAARNWGLQYINGDYLTFLDADDRWLSCMLETNLKAFDDDISLVYSPVHFINEKGERLRTHVLNKKCDFGSLLRRYDMYMQTVMLKVSNIRERVCFDESLSFCPDYDLFMKICFYNEFKSIKQPVVEYRTHSDNLTKKLGKVTIEEQIKVINELKALCQGKYKKEFKIRMNTVVLVNAIKSDLGEGKYISSSWKFVLMAITRKSLKYMSCGLIMMIPFVNKLFYKKYIKGIFG